MWTDGLPSPPPRWYPRLLLATPHASRISCQVGNCRRARAGRRVAYYHLASPPRPHAAAVAELVWTAPALLLFRLWPPRCRRRAAAAAGGPYSRAAPVLGARRQAIPRCRRAWARRRRHVLPVGR